MKVEGRRKDAGRGRRLTRGGYASLVLPLLAWTLGSAAAMPADLGVVRSKYYLIHSDLDDALVYDLGRRMDAMYDEYSRRMSDFDLRADRKPLDVFLFNRKADYGAFTQNRYQNTGGVFVPGKNQLVAYLEGQRDTLRRTLGHEAFHQFAYKATGANMPIWLNEGMAQLFEEAIWTGDAFLMNQVSPRRVRQLQSDVRTNKVIGLKTIMGLSPEKWAATLAADPEAGSSQYNQAWAMVHYMAYGEGGDNGPRLVSMLKALGKGTRGEDAFTANFGNNLEGFRAGFERHALALKPTVEATLIDNHDVLADLYKQLADKGKRFPSAYEFRKTAEVMKYRMRYTRGMMSWTAEPAKYFRDAAGVAYAADEMYFDPRDGAVLPDLVLRRQGYRVALRARFYKARNGRIEHEVLVEPGAGGTTADAGR
jgi:hypothetical protein